jgi:hypothetical protein
MPMLSLGIATPRATKEVLRTSKLTSVLIALRMGTILATQT